MLQLTPQLIIFFSVAALAIASALGMLFSRNTVYAALLLVLNFTTVALIYFMIGAPFIGLAQITIYAGAIMVLFLFVIMLLGTEVIAKHGPVGFQHIAAAFIGLVVIAEAIFVFLIKGQSALSIIPGGNVVDVMEIGDLLYNQYLLPFEITSFILLVAVIGAILLTKQERVKSRIGKDEAKK
ncbi:MAG: NADH-quinone oxidoreductase subunit J [Anaerolinea sp.]|nr:NADH-quinone oxidoreductase subunit J [Anaerolinea sp.]